MAVKFLEVNQEDQLTVSEMDDNMDEYLYDRSIQPYSTKYMKSRLLERLKDRIVIAEIKGKAYIIYSNCRYTNFYFRTFTLVPGKVIQKRKRCIW